MAQGQLRKGLSTAVLLATVGLFISTAIQVGFATNLAVPTVPPDITMTLDAADGLAGLAARDWAAGTCLIFACLGLLAIFDRIDRRLTHLAIVTILILTLLPILGTFVRGVMPAGADWIVFHHLVASALLMLTLPPAKP